MLNPAQQIESKEKVNEVKPAGNQPFTYEQVKAVWREFAETRKLYKAEYQLLTQEITVQDKTLVLHLHNPVQETMLSELRSDIIDYMREKLNNYSLQLTSELTLNDDRQVIYTNREKFDHLAKKNPNLKLLKDRLGLDPDF